MIIASAITISAIGLSVTMKERHDRSKVEKAVIPIPITGQNTDYTNVNQNAILALLD
ncbi:hypothetical protein [Paenibacillus periandrae]|uniref:hypothetical protein n=1 Tax=Paenibacillus periandrae TaxID=1761741 RepID=UPI001F0983E3|nr:hypothetical protein [Paenibacillus periandrae]